VQNVTRFRKKKVGYGKGGGGGSKKKKRKYVPKEKKISGKRGTRKKKSGPNPVGKILNKRGEKTSV